MNVFPIPDVDHENDSVLLEIIANYLFKVVTSVKVYEYAR